MARSIFVALGAMLVILTYSNSVGAQDPQSMFCPFGTFNCRNLDGVSPGSCLNYTSVCDGMDDCYNGTDESFCGECDAGAIMCPNTDICVNNTAACDGYMDCPGGEDESVNACGCSDPAQRPVCRNNNGEAYCINDTLLCNGIDDCINGTDEQFPYCSEECGPEQLSCFGNGNGSICFEVYEICNGVFECPNGLDEGNCTSPEPHSPFCPFGLFNCRNPDGFSGPNCLNYSSVCDGMNDCYNGTDESFCGECNEGMLMCPNTTMCINNTRICDGSTDCPNGEDEAVSACGCTEQGFLPVCRDPNGVTYCINESALCDGNNDCIDGADEQYPFCPDVPIMCRPDQISCDGLCVDMSNICNGMLECPSGFDERDCGLTVITPPAFCPYGTFNCRNPDGFCCLNYTSVCDGMNDCYNGTDESFCGVCDVGMIQCRNSSMCVNNTQICDGLVDCPDGIDESVNACGCIDPGYIPVCRDSGMVEPSCIHESQLCNGVPDCPNGEDESNQYCPTTPTTPPPPQPMFCPYGTFNCRNPDGFCCLNYTSVCDGMNDCYNGTDESFCGVCDVGMIQCGNSSVCVNNTQVCDGLVDCPNGIDESVSVCGCIDADHVPVCRDPAMPEPSCLHVSQLCNGVRDCFDGDDESSQYCPNTPSPPPPPQPMFCPYGTFNCRNPDGFSGDCCLNYTSVCDGVDDCYNGTDESICGVCDVGMIQCRNSSVCVNNTKACDGFIDCPDGIDESVNACGCIEPNHIPICRDPVTKEPSCIHVSLMCNGVSDCPNGSDESSQYCPNPTSTPPTGCPHGYLQCAFNASLCVRGDQVCNGINDCGDGIASDELSSYVEMLGFSCAPFGSGSGSGSGSGNDQLIIGVLAPPVEGIVPLSEQENGGIGITFCIVRSPLSSLDVFSVTIYTTGISADPGQDFIDLSGTTFYYGPDDTMFCENITILDDNVVENSERFSISVSVNASVPYTIFGPTNVTFEIFDNDGVTVDLDNTFLELEENNGTVFEVCLTLTDVNGGLDRDSNFYLNGGYGTARAGEDFYVFNGPGSVTLTIPSGTTQGTQVCTPIGFIIGDDLIENDEFFDFYLSPFNYPDKLTAAENSSTIFNVTILDDDYVEFVQNITALELVKGSYDVQVCLYPEDNLSQRLERDLTVTFNITLITASYEDFYMNSGRTFTLYSFSIPSQICLDVSISDDMNIEDTEMFNITIDLSNPRDVIDGPDVVPVTILDNDGASFVLVSSSVMSVIEGTDTNRSICLYLPAADYLMRDVVINFNVNSLGATDGGDFQLSNSQVTFYYENRINSSQICTQLGIFDDDVIENSESLEIMIQFENPLDSIDTNTTTVEITDNDGASFILVSDSEVSLAEGGQASICLELSGAAYLMRDVVINFNVNNISATYGEDFYLSDTQLTFYYENPFSAPVCTQLQVVDDGIIENSENLEIVIEFENPLDSIDTNTTTVEITDNDGASFTLVSDSEVSLTEGGRTSICLELSGAAYLMRDVVINFNVNNISATDGEDFYLSDTQLTFYYENRINSSQICTQLQIIDDVVIENSESLEIVIEFENPLDSIDTNTTTVEITDNDGAQVEFQVRANATIYEDIGMFDVCVVLVSGKNELQRDAVTMVTIAEEMNTEVRKKRLVLTSEDLSPFGEFSITFSPGSANGTTRCSTVGVFDDSVIEPPESFTISLEVNTQLDEVIGISTETVTILDNDGVYLSLSDSELAVRENATEVSVTVYLDSNRDDLKRDVDVDVNVELVTAEASDIGDYVSQITFGPTDTDIAVTIPIVQDMLVGDRESFVINFSPLNSLDKFNGSSSVTVYIQDDDGATLQLVGGDREETEGGIIEICVQDSNSMLERDVHAEITLAEGTAAFSFDYVFSESSGYTYNVTFSAGSRSTMCVNVTILDDEVTEYTERFTVSLRSFNPLDRVMNSVIEIAIQDNDGVSFTVDTHQITVNETDMDQTVDICITMRNTAGGLDRNATVVLDSTLGLSFLQQELTFLPTIDTTVTQCFNVIVVGDDLVKDQEIYTFTFGTGSPLDNVIPFFAALIVQDDDGATVSFTTPLQTVNEDAGIVPVCVELLDVGDGLRRPVHFNILTDTNMTHSFYFTNESLVEDRLCLDVSIVNDEIVEDNKTRRFYLEVVNSNDLVESGSTEIRVVDNDGATLTILPVNDITEGDDDIIVQVQYLIVGSLERSVTVQFSIIEDTSDVSIDSQSITLTTAGTYSVAMTIAGDNLIEYDEMYTIRVTAEDRLDMSSETSFTVLDDDQATIEYRWDIGDTIPEDVGSFEVCAVLIDIGDGLERDVYTSANSSDQAIPYGELVILRFPAGSELNATNCTTFNILDDELIEDDIGFTISFDGGLDIVNTRDLQSTVVDNDGATVSLISSREVLLEEGCIGEDCKDSATVCVELLVTAELVKRVIRVEVNSSYLTNNINPNTFVYDSSLSFNSRSPNELCINVRIVDDNIYTADLREVELTFSVVDQDDVFREPTTVKISIQDDDSPLVEGQDYIPFIDILENDGGLFGELGDTDDGCSNLIFMNSGLPFGSETQTSLRVCANGVVSFGTSHFNFFSPVRFPSSLSPISQSNVIAPFWNDHDARAPSSRIYYKVYTPDQGSTATRNLGRVSKLVASQRGLKNFTGTWMMIAQWEDVPSFPYGTINTNGGFSKRQTDGFVPPLNTYQAIVITDSVQTYAVFTYNCDNMLQWANTPGSSVYSVVGYNIDSRASRFLTFPSFTNHRLSGLEEIRMLACVNQPNRINWSNLVYLVGNATNDLQLIRAECIKRENQDLATFGRQFNYDAPCPCSFSQARRDSRYSFASRGLASITGDRSFFNRLCYVQRFAPFRPNTGVQLCCYSTSRFDYGALLDSSYEEEGSSLLRFHPRVYPREYLEFDYRFKQSCCGDADICNSYTGLRPSDNCRFYRPQRRAWFWGDPHITTLDGGVYTFNGWGEYTLLDIETEDTSFILQGRTFPVVNSTATQLVAFAFGVSQSSPVEVRVSDDSTGLVVLVNGSDVTANVSNANDIFSTMSLSISRESGNSLLTTFPNGIGVSVTVSSGMLSFVLIVPEEFNNITQGLMGNYNGVATDDVVFRNGTMLAHNVSDRTIHEVGQSWEIDPTDSMFTYPTGYTANNFSHPEHVPAFLDEVVEGASPEVLEACGDNVECIFDASQTGDINIGLETAQTNDMNTDDQNQATNNPPRIQGPSTLFVTLGEEAQLVFNVTDDKNMFNVSVIGGLPVNSTLTPTVMDGYTDFVFSWNLYEVINGSLTFEARDELDAVSVLNVQVQICACENNGNCTLGGLISTTASTIVLNCECSEAWEGRFCTEDVDGCTEFMCFDGVNCTDMRAPAVGAMCGPCPSGYLGDGEKCEDFNECINGTHGCADICINFEGSFECACSPGYTLLNSTHCRDIDECAMLNGNCHQECNNFDGGYNCSCNMGFELTNDSRTCQVLANASCGNETECTQNCVRLFGVDECSCNLGYELANDNKTCTDVNECDQTPCDQRCTNLDGGFECSCDAGYELAMDGIQCSDINECARAALTEIDICVTPKFCTNTPESYMCECPGGTEPVGQTCQEIIVTTMPPPTTAEPTTPEPATISPEVRNDAISVTLEEYTAVTFTLVVQQSFREETANAINEYCQSNDCTSSVRARRQTVGTITADNVMITDIADNSQGQVTFNMFVQTDSGVVEGSNLESAVESYSEQYSTAGFSVSVEPLVTDPPPPVSVILTIEQIIGIAVGAVLAAILLVIVAIILIVCCIRYRHNHHKSFDFTYGLEYQNPVAEDEPRIETTIVTTGDDDDNKGKVTAAPNIYVNPGDLSKQSEASPEAKDDSSERSMQSLILKFGDGFSQDSSQGPEKEELTTL